MSEQEKFCRFCGAPVQPGLAYCDTCGQSLSGTGSPVEYVDRPTSEPSPEPTREQTHEPTPASQPQSAFGSTSTPAKKGGFPIWLIVVLILLFLCVCITVVVGGMAVFRSSANNAQPLVTQVTEDIQVLPGEDETPIANPTNIPPQPPVPTNEPTLEQTTPETSSGQTVEDFSIFDDFSSNQFDWYEFEDEISVHGFENGRYFIQVFEPEWIAWSNVPVEFTPTAAEFDVQVPGDVTGGTFGVLCHILADEDYYYVEIDLSDNTYAIGRRDSTGFNAITPEDWLSTDHLNPDPNQSNHVMVFCDPDKISLFINNQLETEVELEEISPAGEMAIFAFTWEDISAEGHKVYFDNFSAWKPEQ